MGSSELHSSARMATSSSNTVNTSLFSSSTRSNSSVAKTTRNQPPTRPVRAFSNTCVNISLTSVSSSNSDRSLRWSPVPKRICVNSAAKRKLYRTPQPTNTSVSRTVGARTSPRHVFSARKTRPGLRSSGESSDGVTIRLSSCKKTKFNKKSPNNSIKSPQLVRKPSWNSKTSSKTSFGTRSKLPFSPRNQFTTSTANKSQRFTHAPLTTAYVAKHKSSSSACSANTRPVFRDVANTKRRPVVSTPSRRSKSTI
eukprot:525911_1